MKCKFDKDLKLLTFDWIQAKNSSVDNGKNLAFFEISNENILDVFVLDNF
jgi:hypothetical protein